MALTKLASYLRMASAIKFKNLVNKLPFSQNKHYSRFVILGRARTGSTLLHTYLNSHYRILSLGEFLHPAEIPAEKKRSILDYLESEGFKAYHAVIQAVGSKLFYEWQNEPFYDLLWKNFQQDEALKIIHLKRKNHLRTLVSLKIARNNQQWSQAIGQSAKATTSKAISLSKEECLLQFEAMEQEEKYFDAFFEKHPKIEIFYEDLTQQPKKELSRIQHFLGVKEHNLLTLLAHQNPEPLSELILNYAELESAFRNTPWHAYFLETD